MRERQDIRRRATSPIRFAVAALTAAVVAVAGCTSPPGAGPGAPPTTLEPLAAPPGEFSLLSYNVAGLPQEISKEKPGVHIPMIAPLLEDYDLVLTQEDFDWWQPVLGLLDFSRYHSTLRSVATHPYRSSQHPGPAAVGVDPSTRPLLVGDGLGQLSRLPLSNERFMAWPGCYGGVIPDGGSGDCLAMKGVRLATMTLSDGLEVDVYNLHGEAGGTGLDQWLQAEGYGLLAEFIEANSAGRAVIVAGDTNLHIDDVHPDGGQGADAQIWSTLLSRLGLTDSCDATECEQTSMIDKVAFRSGGGVQLEAISHDTPVQRFSGPDGEDLSDHPPLVVEFAWDAA